MQISPDRKWAVETRDGNLWLRDMANGQERALAQDGEPNFGYGIWFDEWMAAGIPRQQAILNGHQLLPFETYWSPDSNTVIAPRIDQRDVAEYPFVESAPVDGSFRPIVHPSRIPLVGEKPPTLEWFAFDVPSGKSRRLEFPYSKLLILQLDFLAVRKTWWSPDNKHLFAVTYGENLESAFFFDVEVATGNVRTVIEEHMLPRMDLNSTSHNPPNVRLSRDAKYVIWFSQRDGWGHLYLYDCQTGKLLNQITKGPWLVRDIMGMDEERHRIYFTGGGREGGKPYYRHLYRVDFDGSHLTLLSP